MIYLAQSDTTVGFLSQDAKNINRSKQRPLDQKVLQTVADLKSLQGVGRIPKKHRNFVRRAKKTTFILPNGEAVRVIDKHSQHHALVKKLGLVYSSSANVTKERFSEPLAVEKSDIIVKDSRGFFEDSASKMYKLSRSSIKRLR